MGHERLGILPKTKKWRNIVGDIGSQSFSPQEISNLASLTLDNVRKQYKLISNDSGVSAAIKFLIILSFCSKEFDPNIKLQESGIFLQGEPTPLNLTKAAHKFIENNLNSPEYGRMAQYAIGDAIAAWFQNNTPKNLSLFDLPKKPYEIWEKASFGSGFCEFSRLFFSKFTERYLNFYLEREASSVISTIEKRNLFKNNLGNQVNIISKHAFETSKITQSFSAGWFNKNVKNDIPSDQIIQNYINYSFEKMREELRREDISNANLS